MAKQITRQTFDLEDCSSNSPEGEWIYTNKKKLGLAKSRTRIVCVEVCCPNHGVPITNASEGVQGKKLDVE